MNNIVKTKILLILITAMFGPNLGFGENMIHFIRDIVDNADQMEWKNQDGVPVAFDGNSALDGKVRAGIKIGGLNGMFYPNSREWTYDESNGKLTVEMETPPTLGRKDTEIRGSYVVTLPELKRVQLEVRYDLFMDDEGEKSQSKMWVTGQPIEVKIQ